MQLASIGVHAIPLILASVLALQAGLYHIMVYTRRRTPTDACFVACCFSIAIYAVCFAVQLCVERPSAVRYSILAQLLAANLFGPSLLWFIFAYTEHRRTPMALAFTAAYGVELALLLAGPEHWALREGMGRVLMVTPWSEPIPYFETHKGPLADAQMALHLAGVPYILWLSARFLWQRRDLRSGALLLVVLVVCVAAVNDIAVYEGWIQSMYATVYAFLFLVIFDLAPFGGASRNDRISGEASKETRRWAGSDTSQRRSSSS